MSSESEHEAGPPRKIGIKDKMMADPGFPITVLSTFVNITLANMLVYGFSGNIRLGMLAGLITIPFSTITNMLDTERDYKIWKEAERIRSRGLPDILLMKKPKYDWDYYEPLRKEIDRFYGNTDGTDQAS